MEQKLEPLISIITPCFNGEKYLDGYFEGILSQKYKHLEVIFVDDGSTDQSGVKAKEYGKVLTDNEIGFVYIYQNNLGQAAAINQGLKVFRGDYLTWLDADDIMLPDNIQKKYQFLKNNPEYGFVINGIQIVDGDSNQEIVKCVIRKRPDGEDTFFEDLIYDRNVVWVPGTILVRRESMLKAIPNSEIFVSREGQNWQLLLPLAYMFKCGYVDECLLKCVSHKDSHSRQERTMDELIARENNFITLCCETLKRIPAMSDEECNFWCREIRIKHNRNKLMTAVFYGDKNNYNETMCLLKNDGYKKTYSDNYLYLRSCILLGKMKRKAFKKG